MKMIEDEANSLSNNSEKQEPGEFTTSIIPIFVYKEISEKFGVGEEKRVVPNNSIYNHEYVIRMLNPEKDSAGFEGAIGIRKDLSGESTIFSLWVGVPSDDNEYSDSDPILQITGGPRETGSWCSGWGKEMKYEIIGKFAGFSGMSLKNQSLVNLISDILKRTSELANDPRCKQPSYYKNKAPVLI